MPNRRGFVGMILMGAALALLGRRPLKPHRKSLLVRPLGDGLVIVDGWVLREREARAVLA